MSAARIEARIPGASPGFRSARRPPRARAAALAAVAVGLALASAAPARADRVSGLGVSAARAREILLAHPLRALDGGSLSVASLRGDVVLITFWASWCSPCRRELPRLDALQAELSGKGAHLLAVSIDEERANAERFAKLHGVKLPIYVDGPGGLARELDLGHVPLTLVLDRDGEVAFTSSRSDDAGLAELAAATRRLASGKPYASRVREGGNP